MSAPLFVRLAPGQRPGMFAYGAIVDFACTYRTGGRDDDEALATARAYFGDRTIECEPPLEDAARRAGLVTRKLEPAEVLVKAREAASLLAPATYGNCPEDEAITDLWEVCRAFAHALASETRPQWYVAAKVTGTFDDVPIERALFLLVQSRPLALRIYDRDVADTLFTASRDPEKLDHLVLDLPDEPVELRAMLAEGMGLDRVPRVRAMSNGVGTLVDDPTYALVSACTAAIARHIAANARGVVHKPLLGGELTVELKTYVEPDPATSTPVRAVYTYGNPFAPMGFGGYTVELNRDGTVVLTHQRYETRRTWRARANDALWAQLAVALESSGFPARPSTRAAPPGTASFSLAITRGDGSTVETSGFPSMEYRDVSFLFTHVVCQISKDAVFGFDEPGDTIYVTAPREG